MKEIYYMNVEVYIELSTWNMLVSLMDEWALFCIPG